MPVQPMSRRSLSLNPTPYPPHAHAHARLHPMLHCPTPQVLDYESSGAHKLIGECQTSLAALRALAASPAPNLDILNPKKAGRPGYRHSGVLAVREVTVRPRPSFLQYISGGLLLCQWSEDAEPCLLIVDSRGGGCLRAAPSPTGASCKVQA